jgi:hypothetical protein
MKKDPSSYTAGETEFAKRVANLKAGRPNAISYRKNVAVTLAGDFVIGLTYSREQERYSCSAIHFDGIRYNHPKRWDRQGKALDVDLSDLNMGSIHIDVNKV